MKRPILCMAALAGSLFGATAQDAGRAITFEQAAAMVSGNRSSEIAGQQVEWARSERQRLNALWFPQITASGAYVHLANSIRVEESLSQFTDPVKDFIHSIAPGEELITSLLDGLGRHSFSVPLAPRDITSIDAVATLPLFTGGKRLYASKIGKSLVGAAEVNRQQVNADQHILLVEAYFGLRLGQQIVAVKRRTLDAMELHLQNALKLEAAGMLTRTERMLFEVNRDEARRELEAASKELGVAQSAFKALVQLEGEEPVVPVTPLFIDRTLPDVAWFKERVTTDNYLLQGLDVQQAISRNQLRIASSAYLPTIALFGKQTLYAHGLRKNLVPRTLVGVGFNWNIFDGLGREKRIRQAKIDRRTLEVEKQKAEEELAVAVDRFYSQTQVALDNVAALRTTLEMSTEIVRARQKSFLEGMATSTEVIDAELLLAKVRVATLTAFFQFDTGLINLLAVCGMPDAFARFARSGETEHAIFNQTRIEDGQE